MLSFFRSITAPLALCGTTFAGGLKLGHVNQEVGSEGGCSVQLPSDFVRKTGEYIFVSNFDGTAVVNLDGANQQLTSVKPPHQPDTPQLGDRSTASYQGAGGLSVEVTYVVTEPCPASNPDCGTTRYDAELSVRRGKEKKTVAAKAVCGHR